VALEQNQLVYFLGYRYFYLYNLVILGYLDFDLEIDGQAGELAHTPLFTKCCTLHALGNATCNTSKAL